MLNWTPLLTQAQFEGALADSINTPHLIFKHSSRCTLSAIAKLHLEDNWSSLIATVSPLLLDVIAHPQLATTVAEACNAMHESPQILLLYRQNCILDASHQDIDLAEIDECLDSPWNK